MRNIYILLIIITISTINAQTTTTVNFTDEEGYTVVGAIGNYANWGGSNFFMNLGSDLISTSNNYKRAFWGELGSLPAVGDVITFEADIIISGDIPTTGDFRAQIGFNTSGTADTGNPDREFIYLKHNQNTGNIFMQDSGGLNFTGSGFDISGWSGKVLTVKVSFTREATAAASTVSALIINTDTGETTNIGTKTGVKPAIFNQATTNNGLYGFVGSAQLSNNAGNAVEYFSISRVSMSTFSTLGLEPIAESLEFNLSNNPVGESVEISGVEAGSEINIYTITGAKASNYVYNGSSLNLSHLNTGVYFIETPGFAVKKMLKK